MNKLFIIFFCILSTYNDWQTDGDFPNQIDLSALVRENVSFRSGAARTKATQLKVIDTTISGWSHIKQFVSLFLYSIHQLILIFIHFMQSFQLGTFGSPEEKKPFKCFLFVYNNQNQHIESDAFSLSLSLNTQWSCKHYTNSRFTAILIFTHIYSIVFVFLIGFYEWHLQRDKWRRERRVVFFFVK